jgi:FMN-dependent NADH-azoreductase
MKNLKFIKEKKEAEKKISKSFSLSRQTIDRYERVAKLNDVSVSDICEEALTRFLDDVEHGNDLESYAENQQQSYQMAEEAV